jgi:hypothetical protein
MSIPALKLALIPILGGGLLWVSMRDRLQHWLASDGPPISPMEMGRLADFLAKASGSQALPSGSMRSAWPVFELEQIRGVDPFDPQRLITSGLSSSLLGEDGQTDAFASPSGRQAKQPETRVRPVQAVFESPRGRSALIDQRLVHVGDQLPDGSQVLDISQAGIVLAVP